VICLSGSVLQLSFDNLKQMKGKIEYGDLFISFYILIIIRQYLWIVPNSLAAWCLSFFLSLAFFLIHCRFKEKNLNRNNSSILLFTFIFIFPLLFIYVLRAAVPDTSFDPIEYHITSAQRALSGFPYIAGDFFPAGIHTYPPTASMVLGLFRDLLGYRAGTIGNFLVMLWIAFVVDKFLYELISSALKRYFFIILIISCEYMFIEMTIYMVDLLGVPLLLEALWITKKFDGINNKNYYICYISLILGLSVALKLTNLAFVIPLLIFLIIQAIRSNVRLKPSCMALVPIAFLFPILPYSTYMYLQTGNPIFPLYNEIFKSPYWDLSNFKDGRWGPKNTLEMLFWPVISSFVPDRFSEFHGYSGRMAISFMAVVYNLFWGRRNRGFLYIWISGALLWSFTTGYIRYSLFPEVLGGIIIVYSFFDYDWESDKTYIKMLRSVFVILLILQAMFAFVLSYKYDWSWRGGNIFKETKRHLYNANFFFKDHSLKKFLTSADRRLIDDVEVWIVCSNYTAGLETLLKPDIPMININEDIFFRLPLASERFLKNLNTLKLKRMFTLCASKEIDRCIQVINKRGFAIKKIFPVEIPFFTINDPYCNPYFRIFLIEVTINEKS
jgi:hypothetical protein